MEQIDRDMTGKSTKPTEAERFLLETIGYQTLIDQLCANGVTRDSTIEAFRQTLLGTSLAAGSLGLPIIPKIKTSTQAQVDCFNPLPRPDLPFNFTSLSLLYYKGTAHVAELIERTIRPVLSSGKLESEFVTTRAGTHTIDAQEYHLLIKSRRYNSPGIVVFSFNSSPEFVGRINRAVILYKQDGGLLSRLQSQKRR